MEKVIQISVIIPVERARGAFHDCLSALFRSELVDFEAILVDDGMDREARRIATLHPCRIVPNDGHGVSAARNTGVRHARAEIVFFIDSDIVVRPDTLRLLLNEFADLEVAGVVGVQSEELPFTDFFSQYKNLWMRYTYLIVPENIALFYTSAAAIRRTAFLKTGGFDEQYTMPSVEDTDFGGKLRRHDLRIRSAKHIEVVHLKEYNCYSTLRTDFLRSAALVRHILRHWSGRGGARIRETSVPLSFMLGVPISVFSLLFLFLAVLSPALLPIAGFAIGIATYLLLNLKFLAYLHRVKGFSFLFKSCVFLCIDILWVDVGIGYGLLSFLKGIRY